MRSDLSTEPPIIDDGDWPGFELRRVAGRDGAVAVRVGGSAQGPAVYLAHSILTSSAVWRRTAWGLAAVGLRVICADTRGHGRSEAPPGPYAMRDLVLDVVSVLDGLEVERVHYVGVSLGGMTGLGVALREPKRLASLCVMAARADSPASMKESWDARVAIARMQGTTGLAAPTAERWFSQEFLEADPDLREHLFACIGGTSVEGFIGAGHAIRGLDYLDRVGRIRTPTTLLVGSNDPYLAQPARDLSTRIPRARLELIPGAGHLPQIDRPTETLAALQRHFEAVGVLETT